MFAHAGSVKAPVLVVLIACLVTIPGGVRALTAQSTAASARNPGPQSPTFLYGVRVELVDLFANVHDGRGKLVTKLRRDDFVVYDDGVPQEITQFSREYNSLSVLILLDTSGSMAGAKLDNACRSLVQFLRHLSPGDEAMLMTFRSKPRIVESFTQNLDRIRNDLRRLEGSGSTALYDAIDVGLDQIRNAHNRRRTLLLISDGINTYGRTQLKDTIEMLRRRSVELFAIGVESDLPEDARERAATRSILNQLTESAGGESFVISDSRDLTKICHSISDQMHNQYTLGYRPPETKSGAWRTIRVETRVPGLTVIVSKAGYYPSEAANAR